MALESSAIPGDPTRAPSAPEAGTQSSGHTNGTLHWAVQLISCGLWKYGLIGVQPSVPQTPFGGEHEACVRFSFPLQVDQVDAPPNRNSEWRVHAILLQMSFRRNFDQQRLYLLRGGVLHMRQNMRIDIERERHAGMSQLFTDDLRGDPGNQ